MITTEYPLDPTIRLSLNRNVEVTFETFVMDNKTGLPVKPSQKKKNLVLDQGLNGMAGSTTNSLNNDPASSFTNLRIGGGTNPNSFASGAITFTQAAFIVTASSTFFTSAMVGAILKYGASGSGGTEVYITAFTNATTVTVATSLSVVSPTAGTVWMVQQTTLQTLLFTTSTYQSNAGDNQTTFTTGIATHKRTFVNPSQVSPYTVNELGWCNSSMSAGRVSGRIVLSSSDVVGPSNFYLVVMTLAITYSPAAPTAVGNVGTGINTAGTAMVEWFATSIVNGTGGVTNVSGFDQSQSINTAFITASYSQQSSLTSGTFVINPSTFQLPNVSWVYTPGSVGLQTLTASTSGTTSGQTCTGIGLCPLGTNHVMFDVLFTTPVTLPTGVFNPTVVWNGAYTRTLVN